MKEQDHHFQVPAAQPAESEIGRNLCADGGIWGGEGGNIPRVSMSDLYDFAPAGGTLSYKSEPRTQIRTKSRDSPPSGGCQQTFMADSWTMADDDL